MNSTVSPPNLSQQDEADHASVREQLETNAAVDRLGKMAAIKSLSRNLKAEDDAVRRNTEYCERELGMTNASVNPGPHGIAENEDEPMKIGEIMSAGDVTLHNYYQGSEQRKVLSPGPVPVVPIQQPPTGMNPLVKNLLIAAGMLGAGGAGSAATYFLSRPDMPVVAPDKSDKDTSTTIEGH